MKWSDLSWRLFIGRLLIVAIFVLFFIRLIDLQLIRGEQFRHLADNNRLFHWRVPAERGTILDRYDQPLILNNRQYFIKNDAKALYSPAKEINGTEALAWMATDSAQVEYRLYRRYSWSSSFAHVLGFVGPVTKLDLKTNRQLRSTDQVGKLGLEKVWDHLLQGRPGSLEFEINALGQRQRIIQRQPAKPGQVIGTSLDPYLSRVAELAMKEQPGAVIIEDANTGQILSLISSPSFDPNLFTLPHKVDDSSRQRAVSNLFHSSKHRFFDKAVSGTYPPGSIFKLVTALAGLEAGSLDAQTEVVDKGVLKVGQYSFSNWLYTALGRTDGPIRLSKAIARSNDIYFYKAAQWTGPETIAKMAKRLGFGQVTGLEIGGENPGLIPTPDWKAQVRGETWYLGDTYHMGIGQGDVLVTPIQIAQLTQAIINNGELCRPSLKRDIGVSHCFGLNLGTDNLELVRQGMLAACASGGTAAAFFEFNSHFHLGAGENSQLALDHGAVACKTGTAEFGVKNKNGARRTHAWFTLAGNLDLSRINQNSALLLKGATPAQVQQRQKLRKLRQDWLGQITSRNLPKQLVITVLVESNDALPYKEGSREAARVARTIWDWIFEGRFSDYATL